MGVIAGAAVGAALLVAAVAVLCVVLVRRRRAQAALAAKARAEGNGVAMAGFVPPEDDPLSAPGPGHRGLWFYEQLHATLVRLITCKMAWGAGQEL